MRLTNITWFRLVRLLDVLFTGEVQIIYSFLVRLKNEYKFRPVSIDEVIECTIFW